MAGITLAQAETQLSEALTALSKARKAVSYGTGDLRVQRATLAEAQADVEKWESKVQSLSRGGISVRGAVPLD